MGNSETGFQSFDQQDADPNNFAKMTSSAIMFAAVLDISPSVRPYAQDMTMAMRELFMGELKKSHRKNDIIIKAITFNDQVQHRSGFAPIINLADDYLDIDPPSRGTTALYRAVYEALESTFKYRNDLEDQGIDVRSNICIITDGEDNESPDYAPKVKALLDELRRNEAWAGSFTITMIGVGQQVNFEAACKEMGLDLSCLVKIDCSAAEIRKQMGVVSQSISSSAPGAPVKF